MLYSLVLSLTFQACLTAVVGLQVLSSNPEEQPQSLTGEICDNRPRSRCEVELDVPAACAGSPASESNCPIVFFLHGAGGSIGPYKFETNLHNGKNNYIGV